MENEELNMQMVLSEVQIASPDLADFLVWCAHQGDEEPSEEAMERFSLLSSWVYTYARTKNAESAEQTHAAATDG